MTDLDHKNYMERALTLARKAYALGEVPVGALIVCDGQIIAEAHNERESRPSALAHAEISCIEIATRKLGRWRLSDCTLITTLEPCVMCSGAILQARIPAVIYGAHDPKGGGQSLFELLHRKELNHRVEIISGILTDSCSSLLSEFFQDRRVKKPQ